MIELAEAYAALAETCAALDPVGANAAAATIASEQALGRVLAADVLARCDSPPFDTSAMDGVAFPYEPGRERYRNLGTIAAGDVPGTVRPGPGECVRIMTGAPLPPAADTVAMVEHIAFSGDEVRLLESAVRGSHIRHRGENIRAGETLFAAGTRVHAGILAGLLSQGIRFVAVRPALYVGVGSTGNEIVDYRRPLQPGQIYNSNAPAVAALLADAAVSPLQLGTFADSLEETARCLAANTDLAVIVLSGGVSMGTFDLVPKAAEMAGFRAVFHKVKMKPGKPIWFGVHTSGTLFFGLPGNPVSALVGTLLFVRPTIAALLTGRFHAPPWASLPLTREVANGSGLTWFQGARLHDRQGTTFVEPIDTAGSGDVVRFAGFETLIRLPPKTSLAAGAAAEVLLSFPGPIR